MRRYLIASILLAEGWLAGCGGERAGPPSKISPTPPTPLSLTALATGPPLLQSLSTGGTRCYELSLEAGQYLQMTVEQRGVDVAVQVLDPAGNLLLRVDSPTGVQGSEELDLVAATAGRHVLEIEASDGDGRYEIRVEALRAATPEDRTRGAAAAAYSRARLFEREGRSAPAAAGYREAAKFWGEVDGDNHQAWSFYRLGKLLLEDPSRRRESAAALHRAHGLYLRVGDRYQQGMSLYFLGVALWRIGEIESAFRSYEQALSLWRELGVPSEEATCLNNLALVRVRQGRLHAALDLYSRAIVIFQGLEDGSSEAATRTNLGLLYAQLGEGRLAVDQYHRALASLAGRTQPPDMMRRAVVLNKLGDVLLWMEGPEAALAKLRETLDLRRRQHDTFGQAVTLNSIGLAQVKANRPREALEAFGAALEIFRRHQDGPAQAVVLKNLGTAYERLGHLARARGSYERGLTLDPHGTAEMDAVFGLARVARRENRLGEAEHRMERSLKLADDVRSQVWRPDLRASYQAARQEQYTFLLDLLAERHRREPGRGHDARAFTVSERARARSLLDLLSAARAHPDSDELRRLDELSRRINTRHLDLLASPQGIVSDELERELAGLLESWRQANAAVQGPPRAMAPSLSVQEAQRLLDEDTLLLEYFLGEEKSYLWAVTSSTSRFVTTLPNRAKIEAAARRAHRGMTESHRQTGEAGARLAAARLSRMVLQPVADLLGQRRLVVVAHGALQAVPFAALPLPDGTDRPLIADHEIVSLPSVSVLAALRSELAGRRPAQGLLAIVADPVLGADDPRLERNRTVPAARQTPALPRLPYAGREAVDILGVAGSRRVLAASGFAASRALVQRGRLSGYRILHFATHSLFDDLHPELSALALSAFDSSGRPVDGQLRAYEISSLDLRTDLVVLSACRTALGREVVGEGMIGLTQGFLHAGAPRLIVSLWDVDDRSTGELMKRFYAALLREGLPPAQALRQAQISLWKEPRWQAPYHWAGFVLQGEWR